VGYPEPVARLAGTVTIVVADTIANPIADAADTDRSSRRKPGRRRGNGRWPARRIVRQRVQYKGCRGPVRHQR
jgi:hypothetical protein